MAKIYRRSDRVRLKFHDVTVGIAPLSQHEKHLIFSAMEEAQKRSDAWALGQSSLLSIKYGLKEITGVEYSDGSKFELKFDDTGALTDEVMEELQNMEHAPGLIEACMQLFTNYADRDFKKIEGVSLVEEKKLEEIVS